MLPLIFHSTEEIFYTLLHYVSLWLSYFSRADLTVRIYEGLTFKFQQTTGMYIGFVGLHIIMTFQLCHIAGYFKLFVVTNTGILAQNMMLTQPNQVVCLSQIRQIAQCCKKKVTD